MTEPRRVLVIRLGALGDIVQSFGPFAAIRARHPGAHITLLTTAPFADWLRAAPWFDDVSVDERPGWWQWRGLARLARRLRGFDLVYDLQTSGRSTWYFWLALCPPWSGLGRFARFLHRDPERDRLHTRERQAGQLLAAGLAPFGQPAPEDLAWLLDPSGTGLAAPYAVLAPGASPHRPEKRWPAERFAQVAQSLEGTGVGVVVIGGAADRPLGEAVQNGDPRIIDLTGQTSLARMAAVLAGAEIVIGNDTGPMHLASALGKRCVVLFGGGSDPALTAPRMPDGSFATVVCAADLADLTVDRVAAALT